MTREHLLDRLAWGVFTLGGALSGGYLLGLGEATAALSLIGAALTVAALRAALLLRRRPRPAGDDQLERVFDQLEGRGRAILRLLESCQRGAKSAPIPLAPLREAVTRTLDEARSTLRRWELSASSAAPSREALEARQKTCERLQALTGDEGRRRELTLTAEHQARTRALLAEAERARWSFWLGLERLLSTLESIDLALRMALTRDQEVDQTELLSLVEAMSEVAGTLREVSPSAAQTVTGEG